jgi:hypothetical protein
MARPKLGESETERLHIKITSDEIEAIDDWRFAKRVPSRSEAVRRLIQIALAADAGSSDIAERGSKLLKELRNVERNTRRLFDEPGVTQEEIMERRKEIISSSYDSIYEAIKNFMDAVISVDLQQMNFSSGDDYGEAVKRSVELKKLFSEDERGHE